MMFTVLFMNTFIHASDAQEFDPGPELEAGCGLKAHIAVCTCVYAWRGPLASQRAAYESGACRVCALSSSI